MGVAKLRRAGVWEGGLARIRAVNVGKQGLVKQWCSSQHMHAIYGTLQIPSAQAACGLPLQQT